jgi:hypothetical protein
VIGLPSLPARTRFACVGASRPSALTSSPEAVSFCENEIMKAMCASMSCFGQLPNCS